MGQVVQVLVDKAVALGKKGGEGRSYAEAPEIDGVVRLLPVEKSSKTYKTGDFVKATIVEGQWPRLDCLGELSDRLLSSWRQHKRCAGRFA